MKLLGLPRQQRSELSRIFDLLIQGVVAILEYNFPTGLNKENTSTSHSASLLIYLKITYNHPKNEF